MSSLSVEEQRTEDGVGDGGRNTLAQLCHASKHSHF